MVKKENKGKIISKLPPMMRKWLIYLWFYLFICNLQLLTCSRVAAEEKKSCPLIHSNRIVWDFTFIIAPSISQCLRPAGKG